MATGVAFTHYAEKALLSYALRNTTTPGFPPATVYLALFTAAPTDQGGGTEVSGGGYARQAVTFAAPTDNGASSGSQTSPTADVTFPVATADYGTVVAAGLFDAATGGNLLLYGSLTESKTINAGDQFKMPSAGLSCLLD
jgi:hypothetical protein